MTEFRPQSYIAMLLLAACAVLPVAAQQLPPPPPPPNGGHPRGNRGDEPQGEPRGGERQGEPRGGAMRAIPFLLPPGRFWDDARWVRFLTLRPEQVRRMDDVFAANKPSLQTAVDAMRREEQATRSMPAADLQDEAKVDAALERVMRARLAVERANAHLLILLRHELDAGQLAQMEKLRQDGPGAGGPPR
jgi:Spy/CpxP family protein refolding chaperone